MCGIVGGWWQSDREGVQRRLTQSLAALQRRGPDDQGCEVFAISDGLVGLGHTRLAIIDLSARGHQPMSSSDQSVEMIFNGEIYNYRELRHELEKVGYRFTSDSDTEVLLQAWRHWGHGCLDRLIGMFAFVVFDRAAAKLTCVRDAFGIKPLYFGRENDNFIFSSDIPSILALKKEKPALDWQRSYNYLVHGLNDDGMRTFVEGVSQLPPGHFLTFDIRTKMLADPVCWWRPTISESNRSSFSQATEQLRECFLKNIRMHLRSDVPLGAALSGGIDSSAVVCAMRHVEPDLPINTFSYIAETRALSEEVWVDRVNTHVRAKAHKVFAKPQNLADDLNDMILAQGEPFGSTSIYAQYRLYQHAKENGITVTLDGQGADEMLAGYIGYPGQRIRSLLDQGNYAGAWRFLNNWSKWPGRNRRLGIKWAVNEVATGGAYRILRRLNGRKRVPVWIDEDALRERGVVADYPRHRFVESESGRRVMAELALSLTQRGLPALLRYGDRNSMRFSVESRVPFLTLGMANLTLSMPEAYVVSNQGETKSVFRAAMRGIVPNDVLDRRDKIGFATPEANWLLSMPTAIRRWLRDDLDLPFFDQKNVQNEIELVISGSKPYSPQVWRWINFVVWYRHFLK